MRMISWRPQYTGGSADIAPRIGFRRAGAARWGETRAVRLWAAVGLLQFLIIPNTSVISLFQ